MGRRRPSATDAGSSGPWEDAAIPASERREAKGRGLAVLMLTVARPPNVLLWRRWVCGARARTRVYVNGKAGFSLGGGREVVRLPPGVEVRDTAWGHHTLVYAHQALLRHALADMPSAQWFALVSGDSLPLLGARDMLRRLERECGLHASQVGRYTERECLQQYTAMSEALQLWRALPPRARVPNWWHDHFAESGIDEEGPYRAFAEDASAPRGVHGHSQFVLLSREHAQAVADMPAEVARDYDTLMGALETHQKLAADEVAVGHYLLYLQDCGLLGGRFLDEDMMHAPLDSKDKVHARLHHKLPPGLLSQDRFLFGRKYAALDVEAATTLLKAWGTKAPEAAAARLVQARRAQEDREKKTEATKERKAQRERERQARAAKAAQDKVARAAAKEAAREAKAAKEAAREAVKEAKAAKEAAREAAKAGPQQTKAKRKAPAKAGGKTKRPTAAAAAGRAAQPIASAPVSSHAAASKAAAAPAKRRQARAKAPRSGRSSAASSASASVSSASCAIVASDRGSLGSSASASASESGSTSGATPGAKRRKFQAAPSAVSSPSSEEVESDAEGGTVKVRRLRQTTLPMAAM